MALPLTMAAPAAARTYDSGDFEGDLTTYRSGQLNIRVTVASDVPFLGQDALQVKVYTTFVEFLPNGGVDGQDYFNEYDFTDYNPATNAYSINVTVSRRRFVLDGNQAFIYEAARFFTRELPANARYTVYTSGTATIPEPATWAMLITGFGLIGATLRRGRVARLALHP